MKALRFVQVSALLLIAGLAWADTLTLVNGTRYSGRYLSGTSSNINFQLDNGTRQRFSVRDIQSLEFGTANSSLTPRQSSSYNQSVDQSGGALTVQPGTEISVRTNEAIRSDSATQGRTYAAQIDRDVTDGSGYIVIPRGSPVSLIVRDLSGGGTVSSSNLVLDLQDVTISGSRYLVNTSDLERSSGGGIGANRRTATMVGGGAALGTLLGAAAGGGRGALLGAIAGAVGGGAVQVLTRGKEVNVPAETVLNFRLDQPLQLVRQ